MGNITGGIDLTIINTSASAKVFLSEYVTSAGLLAKDYATSTAVSAAIKNFITSASASVLVSALTVNFITSASASTLTATLLAPYLTSASAASGYAPKNYVIQEVKPTVGGTVAITSTTDLFYVSASAGGTLASVQVTFPPTPSTGKRINITTHFALTSVSLSAASGIIGGISTMAAAGYASYVYDGAKWIRVS